MCKCTGPVIPNQRHRPDHNQKRYKPHQQDKDTDQPGFIMEAEKQHKLNLYTASVPRHASLSSGDYTVIWTCIIIIIIITTTTTYIYTGLYLTASLTLRAARSISSRLRVGAFSDIFAQVLSETAPDKPCLYPNREKRKKETCVSKKLLKSH